MLTVTTLGGETVLGPHQLQHPFRITGDGIHKLLNPPRPDESLILVHGDKTLQLDDVVVAGSEDEAITIKMLVQEVPRPMPFFCSSEASAMIHNGIRVHLVEPEYVYATKNMLPKSEPPSVELGAALLPAGSEYWAVSTTSKQYMPDGWDEEDFLHAPLGAIDVQAHFAIFWFLVDDHANDVGWILPGRTNSQHLCYLHHQPPEAVFALTRAGVEHQFISQPGWKDLFAECPIEDLNDMNFKDVRSLFRKHGVAKNHSDRYKFLADARAAFEFV